MRALGAYYQTTYNKPISGLGAYYETTYNQAIGPSQDGLGQTPTPVSFAEQELESVLQSVSAGQLVVPWADRQGDIDWQDIQVPAENYMVYPLTDKLLESGKAASFGAEPNWVAILAPKPALTSAVDQALTGRPYRLATTQGVYLASDTKPVPTPFVLYWLELSDDPHDLQAGKGSLEAAAKQLGGQLVFPMPTPRAGENRAHPDIGFTTAIAAPGAAIATLPKTVMPASAAGGGVPKWLWYAGVAGAVGLGWWWWKGRS